MAFQGAWVPDTSHTFGISEQGNTIQAISIAGNRGNGQSQPGKCHVWTRLAGGWAWISGGYDITRYWQH